MVHPMGSQGTTRYIWDGMGMWDCRSGDGSDGTPHGIPVYYLVLGWDRHPVESQCTTLPQTSLVGAMDTTWDLSFSWYRWDLLNPSGHLMARLDSPHKDMSIHVAIAILDPLKAVEGSMGEVGYKLVDSVLPYDLRNDTDLGQFASVFFFRVAGNTGEYIARNSCQEQLTD